MSQPQYFAYGVSGYIDSNGLSFTPKVTASTDLNVILERATPVLTDILDEVTGEDHDEDHIKSMILGHLLGMELMDPVELFSEMNTDGQYDGAPKFYVAIGMDEADLEDLLIGMVGDPDDDEEDYLEEEDEEPEDDTEL
jgi:hypothetical protein